MHSQSAIVSYGIAGVPPNRTVAAPKTNRGSRYYTVPRVRSEASIGSEATMRLFAPHTKALVSSKELAQLRTAESTLVEQRTSREQYGHWAARNAFRAAQKKYQEDPTPDNLKKMGSLSRTDDLDRENSQMRQQIKMAMRNTLGNVLSIVSAIYDRAGKIVGEEIAALAEKERELSDRYGLTYVPSGVVGALQRLCEQLERPLHDSSLSTPRSLLAGILEL